MAGDTIRTAPRAPIEPAATRIPPEFRKKIASAMCQAYDAALSARDGLDATILTADRNYEMMTIPRVYPWKDASNVFVPLIKEQVDALVSALAADVLVPSPFLVLGLTDPASASQHKVQRFYNAQLTARRGLGMPTWLQHIWSWVHLSVLHGTAYLDVTWLEKRTTRKYAVFVEDADPETGIPVLDIASGQPRMRAETHEVEITEYDDVLWEPVELREVILVPAAARSVQDADAVIRILYMSEDELRAMTRPGKDGSPAVFHADAVERVISSVAVGDTQLPNDPRGTEAYSVGGQIDADAPALSTDMDGRLRSTKFEVLRIDSRQIDVNGDGVGENMVFWVHRPTQELLGEIPFPYHHQTRTLVSLAPKPRPNRAYGYGLPEDLRTIQTEINANFNQDNDQRTIRTSPPRYREQNVKVLGSDDGAWGPNIEFIGGKDSVGILPMPDVLPSSERTRQELMAMAGRLAGQSQLATGGVSAGKRLTAKEVQASQRGQGVRQNMMSAQVRYALADALWLTHELKKQYGFRKQNEIAFTANESGQKPERLTLTPEEMNQHYDLLVAGMGGPLDRDAERQDAMLLNQMFAQRPYIAGNPERRYAFDSLLLDTFNRPDKAHLIGTPEEAVQEHQQMIAAQQAQAQAQAAGLGGAPGQGGGQQRPQGGGQQGLGAAPPGLGS